MTSTHLGLLQGDHQLFVVQNVAFGGEEELEDAVLDGLQLVAVGVDTNDQLVPLLLQVRLFQTNHVAGQKRAKSLLEERVINNGLVNVVAKYKQTH